MTTVRSIVKTALITGLAFFAATSGDVMVEARPTTPTPKNPLPKAPQKVTPQVAAIARRLNSGEINRETYNNEFAKLYKSYLTKKHGHNNLPENSDLLVNDLRDLAPVLVKIDDLRSKPLTDAVRKEIKKLQKIVDNHDSPLRESAEDYFKYKP